MGWSWGIIGIVIIFAVFILLTQSAFRPLKILGYGVIQLMVGAIMLFFVNLFGQLFNFSIPINPITALITGLLGIPGLATLVLIKLFII
ncbi:pro-sigmaK processing inhibitor BofA family protein [Microaerobacter geothermalis]|uniref:pro-sigmaK processing inhibitor BofA family protein n=1 Tax=Microaerobacter geothermalis TaxID=674972 RepID=UPI001F262D24|nr:pro-sigmaK processing inhibitor BofA family protein [Microaerobacter geothermalis]MCF6095244.1 pro-sigmaK processing inhibitor BofA family protein [Microaerobacter geothermalis]